MTKAAPIVISLGGSVICPAVDQINWLWLKKFKRLIEQRVGRGQRFIIVVGGGAVCRQYQQAARRVTRLVAEDIDWLGIHTTRLNAHLLRTIFRTRAHPKLNTNPTDCPQIAEPILVAAGWKPGWSTDYVAVCLAKAYGATTVINLSNIDVVYDSDPRTHPHAKPLPAVSWVQFRKLVGNRWSPGGNFPFDPVASKLAQQYRLTVYVSLGKDLRNFERIITGKTFHGSVITP